jgi:hypothetical protein
MIAKIPQRIRCGIFAKGQVFVIMSRIFRVYGNPGFARQPVRRRAGMTIYRAGERGPRTRSDERF